MRTGADALGTSSLVTETERQMLELIARGAPLSEVLDTLTKAIEDISPDSLCTIMLLDEVQRNRLLIASGPSLPQAYLQAVNGLEIGPEVGACGTAAYRNETVIVEDVATDPRFAAARDFVLGHGLRSCWSQPIRDSKGAVLGTFATYRRVVARPGPGELALARVGGQLAGNAIERIRAEKQLRDALRRLSLAETVARFGIWETDFQKNIIVVSEGLAALLERPRSKFQLTRAEFEAMVHPEDRGRLWSGVGDRNPAAGAVQEEFRLVLPSGAVRWMRSQWGFEPGGEPPLRATGAMIDITAEKRMLVEAQQERAAAEASARIAREAERRLSFRARHDALTNLLNRASLYERLSGLAGGGANALALMYLDLDSFKEINDTLGHAAGDDVLQHVARQISAVIRRTDAGARIGGDEFVVVIPGIAERGEAERLAQAVVAAISTPVHVGGRSLSVGASFGISLFPLDGGDADSLLKVADESMYRMKMSHRRAAVARMPRVG